MDSCEQGNERSGSVKGGKVLTSLATVSSKETGVIQGDSLDDPELITINHGIIYRWKQNFASTNLGICRDNLVMKGVEICLLPPEFAAQPDALRLRILPYHHSTRTRAGGRAGTGSVFSRR